LDLATVIGFVLGLGFFIGGIISATGSLQGLIEGYIDIPSIIIVVGGSFAATIASYTMDDLKNTPKIIKNAFSHSVTDANMVISQIIELANVARKEGLLALEEYGSNSEDDFLKKGIMLIVDGTDPELVRNILETELVFLEERHSHGKGMMDTLAAYGPAFGMIGTLIGLINMLGSLSDVDSLGPQMAIALVTTLYGSFLANVIWTPISTKLSIVSKQEVLVKELMIEGLLSIQAGENPRIIEEKLKTFIPPDTREKFDTKAGQGKEE